MEFAVATQADFVSRVKFKYGFEHVKKHASQNTFLSLRMSHDAGIFRPLEQALRPKMHISPMFLAELEHCPDAATKVLVF